MNEMEIISTLLGLISLGFILIALIVLIITLNNFTLKDVRVVDYSGNKHRARIRYAQKVPNNGILYRYMHKRKELVSYEEKLDWIDENRELYDDIMAQKYSRHPYDKVMVTMRI